MLNPEVVKFPAPENFVSYSQHSWHDSHNDHSWQRVIDHHPFNTKVSLLLPDTPSLPEFLHDSLTTNTEFYLIKNLPVLEFCSPVFLQAFLKTGQLYAVSCKSLLDVDNTAALTPDGQLHLILNKFTYQELSLSGTLSAHILRKPLERFVVKVNMKEPSFKPGRPHYTTVTSAFTQVHLTFTFWLTWIPDDTGVCPSSIAKYFHDLGYSVEERKSSLSQSIVTEVDMPVLGKDGEDTDPEDVFEWIGCQTLGVHLKTEGTTVCEVVTPKPSTLVNNVCSLQCTGFFTPRQLSSLLSQLRLWLKQRSESAVPWLSMTVYGHPDSPINWGTSEHVYHTNGDNLYTLVILRDQLRLYKVSCSRKPQRMYVKSNKNK
ncbi:ribonuclease P protein subunit p40-like [Homarus americanus]|uniref:ribonuclease P protein subunit p40-like n=1 Tax=Homarus americanus TaxID=6706 RepID=UPI001C48040F|nr:ribonuclease P protein subunit p40-like [Homarus americanus]XP_042206593.1 ribonuclease P protein subunit p40-like [Homarus americanus]